MSDLETLSIPTLGRSRGKSKYGYKNTLLLQKKKPDSADNFWAWILFALGFCTGVTWLCGALFINSPRSGARFAGMLSLLFSLILVAVLAAAAYFVAKNNQGTVGA